MNTPIAPTERKPSKHECPKPVADAITAMEQALKAFYGYDIAYTIMGNGHLIAASNSTHGVVDPNPVPA